MKIHSSIFLGIPYICDGFLLWHTSSIKHNMWRECHAKHPPPIWRSNSRAKKPHRALPGNWGAAAENRMCDEWLTIFRAIHSILHVLYDLDGFRWISHFLQVFLKNLPSASWNSSHLNSRACEKVRALEVPFVGKQWLHFTSCHVNTLGFSQNWEP